MLSTTFVRLSFIDKLTTLTAHCRPILIAGTEVNWQLVILDVFRTSLVQFTSVQSWQCEWAIRWAVSVCDIGHCMPVM